MIWYEQSFLAGLKSRNEASFTKLYQDTVDMFYRYIKSHYNLPESSIQDILSETYLKIWNNLSHLDDSKKIFSYLWTILKNTAKDHFKSNREIAFSDINRTDEQEAFEDTIQDQSDLTELFETQFQSEVILQAMNQLDDKFQQVIFLKYIEWLDNDEIALQLDITEENIRQRLSRGLAKLRASL